jgi:hypothetical protein
MNEISIRNPLMIVYYSCVSETNMIVWALLERIGLRQQLVKYLLYHLYWLLWKLILLAMRRYIKAGIVASMFELSYWRISFYGLIIQVSGLYKVRGKFFDKAYLTNLFTNTLKSINMMKTTTNANKARINIPKFLTTLVDS